MAVITGKCKWASVQQPNTKFEPCWTIDIILSDQQGKSLEKAGYKIKKDKDGDLIFKIKRKVASMKGKTFDPPTVVDREGNEFKKLIGNGSEVKVKFTGYTWEASGDSGKSGWLDKVMVLNHVPYEEEDEEDFGSSESIEGASTVTESFDEDIPF